MSIEETIREEVRTAIREEVRTAIKEAFATQLGGRGSDDDILDCAEAGAYVKAHEETIRRLVRSGAIPRHGHGRMVRVRRGDLRDYFTKHYPNGKPILAPVDAAAAFLERRKGRP